MRLPPSRGRRREVLLLALALIAVGFHWLRVWLLPVSAADERRLLPAVFPAAHGFSAKTGTPPRSTALAPGPGGAPVPLGAVVRSDEIVGGIRGYGGPVPVLVGVTAEGKISGVALLEHHETPAYVGGLEHGEFLRQFAGKAVGDPLLLDKDIDGVTRATVTARAVTDGVRRASRETARTLFGIRVPEEEAGRPRVPWAPAAILAAFIGLAAVSLRSGGGALRWVSLLAGLAFLGFWQRTWLSAVSLANIALWRLPAVREQLLWYLLAGAGIVATLLWRNLYCARLCPFGALQELARRVSRGRLAAAPGEERAARGLRLVLFCLATIAVFLFDRPEAAHFEPFSTAFDFQGGRLRWALLAAVLAVAALRHRFWCRYFCPTGACLDLLHDLTHRSGHRAVPAAAPDPPHAHDGRVPPHAEP
jgi:hypothetical protein